MPVTTRRSTGGARAKAGPGKGQSTISFASKVTKTGVKDAKKSIVSEPVGTADTVSTPEPVELESKEEVVEAPQGEEEEKIETKEIEAVVEKNESEVQAEKISDARITKYWAGIEKQRIAPRVHQEGLPVSEQVLRYFDVSSQYGVSFPTPS
jgi:DNA polymerase delta subunit 4